ELAESMRVDGQELQTNLSLYAGAEQRELDALDKTKVSAQLIWDQAKEANQASRLAQQFAEARIEERNYVLYGDEKAYQSLLTLIEQMDAEAVRIRAELDNDTDRTNADRFIELLRHYATDL